MDIIKNTTKLAHYLIKPYISEDALAIDCTLGNGFDSLELLKMGASKVLAFDIQENAISSAKNLILEVDAKLLNKITFILDSHQNIDKYTDCAKVVIFNLGYLPSGDKSISTLSETTMVAIEKSLSLLERNGICVITMYDGHFQGEKEKKAILQFAEGLDSKKFHCIYLNMLNQHKNPPEILIINKKK